MAGTKTETAVRSHQPDNAPAVRTLAPSPYIPTSSSTPKPVIHNPWYKPKRPQRPRKSKHEHLKHTHHAKNSTNTHTPQKLNHTVINLCTHAGNMTYENGTFMCSAGTSLYHSSSFGFILDVVLSLIIGVGFAIMV